ncbi:hypothetical protein EV426DRAFT_578947 [Tirmania nivea]|nr:hypothetical protein EV426DRAFT_578947 [Tirmania nivea]
MPAKQIGRKTIVGVKSGPKSSKVCHIGNFYSQVKKYQMETGFLIPHLLFSRVCYEIVNDISAENVQDVLGVELVTRISPDVVYVLQTEADNYIMKYLSNANYFAIHGG